MAKGYSMYVRAVPCQYIGSPWRGVPGDNHRSIPGYTCMCRSRASIRAALRFVEIAHKAICDRKSPAVLREHAQFGAQRFVMSVHSPQQQTCLLGPPVPW
jgi:hypothetical protein